MTNKPGQLFVFAPLVKDCCTTVFCPVGIDGEINNCSNFYSWKKVRPGAILMFVESKQLSQAAAENVSGAFSPAVLAVLWSQPPFRDNEEITTLGDMAWDEIQKKGKIPGSIFLVEDFKIWVSHYELKHFKKWA